MVKVIRLLHTISYLRRPKLEMELRINFFWSINQYIQYASYLGQFLHLKLEKTKYYEKRYSYES